MQMRFEKDLPVGPEVAWDYLTCPEQMNLWSEAHIDLLSTGETNRSDAVGATRRVTVSVCGLRARLIEIVEESHPPQRFVYRVTSGGGLSQHRGTMTLEPIPSGTHLTWEVVYQARFPGLSLLMRWAVGPSLQRSLAVLEKVVQR